METLWLLPTRARRVPASQFHANDGYAQTTGPRGQANPQGALDFRTANLTVGARGFKRQHPQPIEEGGAPGRAAFDINNEGVNRRHVVNAGDDKSVRLNRHTGVTVVPLPAPFTMSTGERSTTPGVYSLLSRRPFDLSGLEGDR